MQLALKHIKDKDALPFIQFLMQNIVKPLDQVKDADKIELVLTYLANKANIKDKPAFKQLVCESLEPELEETMMSTMVQYWTEEGLQMGIEQGMLIGEEKGKQKWLKKGQLEAQLSVAKELLAENFSQERVARLTKLPLSEIAALARDRVLQTVD